MTFSGTPGARARSRESWAALADRVRSIGPGALGRGLLALGVVGTGAWLTVATWPSLLPFLVGGVLAYAVLPVANRLDRYMPRVFAAVIAELLALAILAGVTVVVVPPLLDGLVQLVQLLPTAAEVRAWLTDLQAQLGTIPEPVGGIVLAVLTEVAAGLSGALTGLVEGAGAFVTNQVLGILGTATFLLGLLVIPAWILTLVADEQAIKRRAAGLIAPALRPDVVASFRIVDRALATFIRVRVLLAIVAATLLWLGLMVAQELGIAEFPYAVAGSVLLGSLLLIPELGFILGLFPILLVLIISGPVPAATVLAVYFAANRVASALVETRVSRGVLDVHPALLIPGIVVLSEFGLIWLLAAAPVMAIARDLVRYGAGRMADPPQPAGVLPGQRTRTATAGATAAAAIRSVYRDRPGPRPAAGAAPVTARSPIP